MKKKLSQKLVFFILFLLLALLTIVADLYINRLFSSGSYAQKRLFALLSYIMVPTLALVITKIGFSKANEVVRRILLLLVSAIAIVMLVGLMLMRHYGTDNDPSGCPPGYQEVCNNIF